MTGAPTELEETRLRELNVQLRKPVESEGVEGCPVTEVVHPDAAR